MMFLQYSNKSPINGLSAATLILAGYALQIVGIGKEKAKISSLEEDLKPHRGLATRQ
jgi:hypothetical protein